jgi:cadmium resistance protein CadD (predicted permease)
VTETSFAIASATFAAFAATNVDSAALMLAFSATARPIKLFVAFVATGAAVVATSLLIGLAASAVEMPSRYFGVVPLSIGLYQLVQGVRRRRTVEPEPIAPPALSLSVMGAAFLSVSTDNLVIYSALLAGNGSHIAPWTSAWLVVLYVLMGLLGVWAGNKVVHLSVKFRSLAPVVTACVGLTALLAW